MEKYRMGKKDPDIGNRRRAVKNFVRFVKNPLGYTFWKHRLTFKNTNLLFLAMGLGFFYHMYAL